VFLLFLSLRRSLVSFCSLVVLSLLAPRRVFTLFYGQSFSNISVYCTIVPFILIMSTNPSFILTVLFIILLCHAKYHSSLSPSKFSNHATATTEFGFFNIIPILFFFTASWSPIRRIPSTSLVILINLKLNSCLLVFLNSFRKFLIQLFICPLMSL